MPKTLTLANVRAQLQTIGIVIRRTHHGELRVNFKGGTEATAYYTTEYDDALATGQAMVKALSRVRHDAELAIMRAEAERARVAALGRMERLLLASHLASSPIATLWGHRGVWFGIVVDPVNTGSAWRSSRPIGQARWTQPSVHASQVSHLTAATADLLRCDLKNDNATAWWQPSRSR